MKLVQIIALLSTSACLPLTAQAPQPGPGERVATAEPAKPDTACKAKGCPEEDQHGHPPVSCAYRNDLSTAFHCILMCTYADSQWGTLVAASNCD